MTTKRPVPPITRVGILAKANLRAAVPHLVDIEAWLADREIEAVFETETAQEVLGKQGDYDAISVVAEDGVSATQLRASIFRCRSSRFWNGLRPAASERHGCAGRAEAARRLL